LRDVTPPHLDVAVSKIVCAGATFLRRDWGRAGMVLLGAVIATLDVRQPRRLQPFEAVIFAAVHATNALTGSCASDLFRAEILQRHPFPTDFGLSDHYAGTMRGVILGICPQAQIVDITHCIPPFQIGEGAYTIAQAWRSRATVARLELPSCSICL
jgi:hypothetical protein